MRLSSHHSVALFVRDTPCWSRISQRCFVRYYGSFFNENRIMLCTEFMDGPSLEQIGRMPEEMLGRVIVAVLQVSLPSTFECFKHLVSSLLCDRVWCTFKNSRSCIATSSRPIFW